MDERIMQPYLAGKVEDVMTRDPVVINQEESIFDLVKLFFEHQYHGMPVVDNEGRVFVVVRDSDIIALFTKREPAALLGTRVKDIMHVPPFTIGPQDSIQRATTKMFADGARFLVIVAEGSRVLGVVTRIDLMKGIGWREAE